MKINLPRNASDRGTVQPFPLPQQELPCLVTSYTIDSHLHSVV